MKHLNKLVAFFLVGFIFSASILMAQEIGSGVLKLSAEICDRYPSPKVNFLEIAPKFFIVQGSAADFDSCNSSVDFKLPPDKINPPIVIIAHGGGGSGASERNIAIEFNKLGFATLNFDAFKMNGLNNDSLFWAEHVSNESRQRLIFKATLGAYKWAITNNKIDSTRIFFHGISNGASVVVNIAAAVDPKYVKGVFAEGLMTSGLGVPDRINVPVRLTFGKLDNYGGRKEDEWRWLLKESCKANGRSNLFIQPSGSAQQCNFDSNSEQMTESPIEWFESQKRANADIDIWFIDNAAHDMFAGPLNKQTRTWGSNDKRYAWTGGSSESRQKFLEQFKKFSQ